MSHLQNYNITFTVIACDEDDALATLGRKLAESVFIGKLPDFKIVAESLTPSTND